MNWMPEFLRKSYQLDLSQVGYFAFLPWALAAVLLFFFGSWSDRILRRTKSLRKARSYQIAGTQIFAAISILPVSMIDNLYVAIASITLAVGATLAANAAYYAVIADLVPRIAGTAMGVMRPASAHRAAAATFAGACRCAACAAGRHCSIE